MVNLTEQSPRLTEAQVRDRLEGCADPDVIKEVYDFGLILTRDTLEQIKTAESKATSFAGYGTAIATLLVSTSGTWSKIANACTFCIAFFAALAALICTTYCVKALRLVSQKVVSEEDWLKADALKDIGTLRLFRTFSLWGVLESRIDVQARKTHSIRRAQVWLAGAVGYLAFLLFQLAASRLYYSWIVGTVNVHQRGCWQDSARWISLLSSWGGGLLCVLGLIWLYRRSRSAV